MTTKSIVIAFWMITNKYDNSKKFNTKYILTEPAKHPQASGHSFPIYSKAKGKKKRRLLWRPSLCCEGQRDQHPFSFYRGQGYCREHNVEFAGSFLKDKQEILCLVMFRYETLVQCQWDRAKSKLVSHLIGLEPLSMCVFCSVLFS